MQTDIRYKSQYHQSKASILEHSRGVVSDIWGSMCDLWEHVPLAVSVVIAVVGFPIVVPLLAMYRRQLSRMAVIEWERQHEAD